MKLQTLRSGLKTLTTSIPILNTSPAGAWRTGKESSTARGYGYKWQQAREEFLKLHPLCECDDCQAGAKRVTVATVVDHRIAHRGDQKLFWDRKNWQAMSAPCHNAKTQRETAAASRG